MGERENLDRLVEHLVQLNAGRCSITDESIEAEPDSGMQEVLAGLMLLHENLEYKEQVRQQSLATMDRARMAAEQSIRTRSDFLARMSHELRTPLHTILGSVELMLRNDPTASERQDIENTRAAAETLLSMVDDMLDFARTEAGRIELACAPFDLHVLVAGVCALLDAQARTAGLDLSFGIDASCPRMLLGDEIRLRQVLVNVMGNAVKFTRHGSVILHVSTAASNGGARLVCMQVTDTGIGIPEDRLDHVFEAFTQVDGSIAREFGGTGLGLAIARSYVELMGGRIEVRSALGHGSTFRILVPLVVPEP